MFKEFGMLANLLGNKGKLQEEVAKFQQAVAQITADGTAGAGYVTVKASGKGEIQSVRISAEAMALNDREMLEDLIAAATNQALSKVREAVAQETQKIAQNMGLPPGMLGGVPGLG
jgi:DNA-binding YbaB/EbfC family protein